MDTEHIKADHKDPVAAQVDRMTNEGGPDPTVPADTRSRLDRMMTYAREHPRLAVLGAAGIGLFGGIELAAAVLVGAGVAALVKLPDRAPPMEAVRDRARSFIERVRHVTTKADSEH